MPNECKTRPRSLGLGLYCVCGGEKSFKFLTKVCVPLGKVSLEKKNKCEISHFWSGPPPLKSVKPINALSCWTHTTRMELGPQEGYPCLLISAALSFRFCDNFQSRKLLYHHKCPLVSLSTTKTPQQLEIILVKLNMYNIFKKNIVCSDRCRI